MNVYKHIWTHLFKLQESRHVTDTSPIVLHIFLIVSQMSIIWRSYPLNWKRSTSEAIALLVLSVRLAGRCKKYPYL